MWRVAAMQEDALFVMRAWGFRPHSEVTWVKKTVHGKPHFGMGHVVRASHEVCLIGMRGRTLHPAVKNVRSVFEGLVREHSEKPEAFYGLVEALYPEQTKLELFARRTRAGWHQRGDQLGILDET
jgi:N6-adenosine-specific RNA methylase IME4